MLTRREGRSTQEYSQPRTWQAIVGVENVNHTTQGLIILPLAFWINRGDTLVWTANAGDMHTVTFLPPGEKLPPFTGSSDQIHRVGGDTYNGEGYFNSGLMSSLPEMNMPTTYALTFDVTGDFIYYCLLHHTMFALVHVRPEGTPYPFSQEEYNNMIEQEAPAILRDGEKRTEFAEQHASNTHVILGIGDGLASIMRFFPSDIVIPLGATITFANLDAGNPHTATFGPTPEHAGEVYGDPNDFQGQPLSSGLLLFGQKFRVTFNLAGEFPFRCLLHSFLGMKQTITVLSR